MYHVDQCYINFDDLDVCITPLCGHVVISIFSNTEVLLFKNTEISFLAIPQSPNDGHKGKKMFLSFNQLLTQVWPPDFNVVWYSNLRYMQSNWSSLLVYVAIYRYNYVFRFFLLNFYLVSGKVIKSTTKMWSIGQTGSRFEESGMVFFLLS